MTSMKHYGNDYVETSTASSSMTSYNSTDGANNSAGLQLIVGHHRSPIGSLSWYVSTSEAAASMIPLGLLTLLVNLVTCLALVAERALQTTLYTYMASLGVCDVIGAAIVTPLAAMSLIYDSSSVGKRRVGDCWYALDAFLRTAQFVHFFAASLDAYWQLSGARNLHYHGKRHFPASSARHVIPRRALAPRLIITWLATVVMAVSPFIWYYFVAASTATGNWQPEVERASNVRKLVLLVFVLSFAIPTVGSVVAYGVLLRTWLHIRNDSSLAVVLSNSMLARTGSGVSRRSMRAGGGGSRQASLRASRRSRNRSQHGGAASSAGGGLATVGGCRSSPQLDRHPSVRYSIRRNGGGSCRRDGSRSSIERDSAEASLLAEVIAAETAAAMQTAAQDPVGDGTGRSASFNNQPNNISGPFGLSRTLSGRESPKSNRSSRSDRCDGAAKIDDPSPTRRFAKNTLTTSVIVRGGLGTSDVSGDRRSGGSTGHVVSETAEHYCLSPLRAPLCSQRSNPEVMMFGSPDVGPLSPRGSHDELVKALVGEGVVKKRSFIRRHSTRARRSQQPSLQDSPKLDRHPSLRYSTTRLHQQTTTSTPSSRGDRLLGGSLFGRKGVASCTTLSVSTATRHATVPTAEAAHGSPSVDRKASSGSNASSSIGTCHDLLQPSVSVYSISRHAAACGHQSRKAGGRLQLDSTGSSPETECEASADVGLKTASRCGSEQRTQRRSAEDGQALLADRTRRNTSNVNLLQLAPFDGNHSPGVRRNRSAEDFSVAASNRLSPASCRHYRPVTPDFGGSGTAAGSGFNTTGTRNLSAIGVWSSSNQLRKDPQSADINLRPVALDSSGVVEPHGGISSEADHADVVVIGAIIVALITLWLPALVVDLTAALRLQCRDSIASTYSCDSWRVMVSVLHVVGNVNGLVRPLIYQTLNRTLRSAVLRIVCRRP